MWGPILIAAVAGQVGLDAAPSPLAGRLALRLLDEQFDVVPAGAGEANLTITTASTTIGLQVDGARTVRDEVVAAPRAVAELELFHRVVLALRAAGTRTTTQATPLLFVESMPALRPSDQERIARAVLASDLGLAATSTRADAVVCVQLEPPALGAGPIGEPCEVKPVSGPLSSAVGDAVARALAPPPPPRPPPEPGWWTVVRAAGGAGGRASAIDPTAALGVAFGRGLIGGRLDAMVLVAKEPDVSGLDFFALAGPDLRFLLDRWRFSIGARIGLALHRFDVTGSTSGFRADFAADLPVGVALRLPPVAVELQLAPGLTSRDRRHTRGEEVLWERGAFRLIALLGVAWEP